MYQAGLLASIYFAMYLDKFRGILKKTCRILYLYSGDIYRRNKARIQTLVTISLPRGCSCRRKIARACWNVMFREFTYFSAFLQTFNIVRITMLTKCSQVKKV